MYSYFTCFFPTFPIVYTYTSKQKGTSGVNCDGKRVLAIILTLALLAQKNSDIVRSISLIIFAC